ncbi:MAG TPA: hypothetical protein VHV51_08280 [Polyangiaceae bacterium]|nr:hypothetical protein [Polyangiaceae bacterium]
MPRLAIISGLLCGAALVVTKSARAQSPDANEPATAQVPSSLAEPRQAAALDGNRVIVLVPDPERPALAARLHAELDDLGFAVEEAPSDLTPDAFDAFTDGARVVALVRIDEATQAIEFRVRAPRTGELSLDRVPIRPRRADVAAVATVELLRARLIKLGLLEPPPPPPAPLPAPALPPPTPRFASLTMDVNAGAWYSAGGLGVSPTLAAGLRLHPLRWLAVGAVGAFEPQTADFSASEGVMHSRAMLVGVMTDFGFNGPRVSFELGGGVALSMLWLEGDAGSPYAGRDTHNYGVAPLGRASLGFRLAGPVSLRTQLLGGVTSPRVAVRFADRTVAHWGRPFALTLIGLEFGF